MVDFSASVLLVLVVLTGVLIAAIRLPGTWLITVGSAVFAWHDDWQRITPIWLAVLLGMALMAEVVELLASVFTARRAGASKASAWGGLVGGILGAIFLSFPLLVVGTLLGAVLGCFLGAMVVEVYVRNRLGHGARVGLFSAIGFALGAAAKVAIALAMAGIVLVKVFWPTVQPLSPNQVVVF